MLLALEATVVVGDAVEVEVGDQPVEPDGDLCGPAEVVLVDRAVQGEDLAGEVLAGHDLGVGDRSDPYPEVVELEHLHVTAEVHRHERQVGGDVEHAGVEVAHDAVPCVLESSPDAGRLDPPGDLVPGPVLLEIAGDRAERNPCPHEGVGDLGQRAGAAVGEPLPRTERRVVHVLGGLQVDDQHRGAGLLRDRQQHRRRHVGREEADDQVAAGLAELLCGARAVLRVGDEADVDDLAVELLHPVADPLGRLLQLREQVGELRPVRAEAAGDETDPGAPGDDPIEAGQRGHAGRRGVEALEQRAIGRHRRNAAATPASTGMCRPVVWDSSPPVRANTAAATCSGSTSRLSSVRWA